MFVYSALDVAGCVSEEGDHNENLNGTSSAAMSSVLLVQFKCFFYSTRYA